jgi:hypothetical protein
MSRLLIKLKVRYFVHKKPPLAFILSQVNPVHTAYPIFNTLFIIITVYVYVAQMVSSFGFATPSLCMILIHVCFVLCQSRSDYRFSNELVLRQQRGLAVRQAEFILRNFWF